MIAQCLNKRYVVGVLGNWYVCRLQYDDIDYFADGLHCIKKPQVMGIEALSDIILISSDTILTFKWASYQIRKIAGCACAGNAGNVFPCRRFQRKPLVSDPGMHHGTCVTHVPWCMSGSLTCGDRENVPGIPGACAPAILRIWQEAHGIMLWTPDGACMY